MEHEEALRSAHMFFNGSSGLAGSRGLDIWKNRRFGFVSDRLFDMRLRKGKRYRSFETSLLSQKALKILIVGVESEKRKLRMDATFAALQSGRHEVTTAKGDVGGRGKLENVNLILSRFELADYDWIIVTDDDIEVPAHFIDRFIGACEMFDLKIAMPAHRFNSYSGYDVTRRGWASLARATRYVEVGPLTAFRRECFRMIFPLPELKYGWGVDMHWPLLAARNQWAMGVVDAVPIRHLNPVGGSYSRAAATEEASRYLAEHGHLSREETFQVVQRFSA